MERKASDLLSPWVGETEKQLAAMFHEAKATGAIVFLDEAETFLSARGEAMASWQVSQTNELLTRMADFDGICIAATNLVDRFDSAAFRRFDLKVTFRPLTDAQRHRLLEAAFDATLPPDELRTLHAMSSRLDGLCTGDVVAVKRGMLLSGAVTRAADLAELLSAEVARRERRRAKVIGFG
jgi:SpoVK/Ycf46/Vps4 family AAA+-type ATPase